MTRKNTKKVSVYLLLPKDRRWPRAEWVEPGTTRRRSRSLRSGDPEELERMRAELELKLNLGIEEAGGRCGGDCDWGPFVSRYEEEKLLTRKPATRTKVLCVLRGFHAACRPKTVGDIDAAMVSRFALHLRSKREVKPVTVATHLAHLRAALRWAERQGLIRKAPVFEAVKVPKKKTRVRTIDEAQYARLANGLPAGPWRLLAQVAWYTGMRRGELAALSWREGGGDDAADARTTTLLPTPWIDLPRRRIWLPAEACKSGADDSVPIHPELGEILTVAQAAPDHAARRDQVFWRLPRDLRNLSTGFIERAVAAGVPCSLHDLRRSFGTRYAAVVPAQVLQRLMRHADISTTLRFYVDRDKGLDEAILKA